MTITEASLPAESDRTMTRAAGMFRLGIITNPWAGLGGSVALKGSDGEHTRTEALARGAEQRAPARMTRALSVLAPVREQIQVFAYAGAMGEDQAREAGFTPELVGESATEPSSPADTQAAVRALQAVGVDLILFAGGDGTARNVADALTSRQPVLGVPSGVKMHSGVYAITPEAAGQVVRLLLDGQLVPIAERDVRDIDEDAFRAGQVRARLYGSLLVPEEPHFVQQTKISGVQVDELAQVDLAAEVIEHLEAQTLYIIGPGSTTHVLLRELGLAGTLLGVDILYQGQLIGVDVTAEQIRSALIAHSGPVRIIVTAIGGQGHIIGRGNQQLAADILARVGRDNLIVIATRDKMLALEGRPLLVDSNDPLLDQAFSGYLPVITGYREQVMYPVGLADYCE